MTEKRCKFCGAQIVFVRALEGEATLPLQRVTDVYVIDDERERAVRLDLAGGAEAGRAVNHWQTCPKAEAAKQWQARKREREARAQGRGRR